MADTDKVVVTKSKLTAIADAIRAKNSTTDKMSLDSIPTIIANLKTGGGLSETTVTLNLARGDQTVSAPKGTGYSKITISKPATLLPANIASGVEIAGVTGTASVDGTKARLNTPTISWNGSSSTLTITNPSSNGNFADGYYIYKDGVKADTITAIAPIAQGSVYNYDMGWIGDNVTAVLTATTWASDMVESDKPASITYGHYTVAQTLSSHLQTDSAPTSKYHNQPISETISVGSAEGSEQTALTPTVTNPSSSSYTFAIPDGQTYYESTNKGKQSTYAYGKFAFTATTACRVYVQYVSSGESSFDYGIISKVDKELSKSDNGDTASDLVAVNAKGKPSTETKTVCIGDVDAGEHYFTAKFRKDGSADNGNDSLRIIGIYFNSLAFPEHVYLPVNIDCTYADGTAPDYTWDPFTGALSIPKVQGKLTITITESNTGLLRPSTLTRRKKTVFTWTAVANATTYEIHAFSDSMTDRAIYTGTDLTFDLSSVITEEGNYTIYVVAKADGFKDSSTTGASRISLHYDPNGKRFSGGYTKSGQVSDVTYLGDWAGYEPRSEELMSEFPFCLLNRVDLDTYKADGTKVGTGDLALIKMPNCYVKIEILDDGSTTVMFANYKVDDTYQRLAPDQFKWLCLGCYKASLVDGILRSVAGNYAIVNSQAAQIAGLPYFKTSDGTLRRADSQDWRARAMADLLVVGYLGTFNSQEDGKGFRGIVDYSWNGGSRSHLDVDSQKTGVTDSLGRGVETGELTGTSTTASLASGKRPFKVLGMENLWGYVFENVSGLVHKDGRVYAYTGSEPITAEQWQPSDTNTALVDTGIQMAAVEGFQKTHSTYGGFLFPTAVGGSDSTGVGDFYLPGSGWRIMFLGGCWRNGSHAGLFCLDANNGWGSAYSTTGARLSAMM